MSQLPPEYGCDQVETGIWTCHEIITQPPHLLYLSMDRDEKNKMLYAI